MMDAKKVDVLAVMDGDGRAVALAIDESKSQHREQSWTRHLKEHDKARAAVADLINGLHVAVNFIEKHEPTFDLLPNLRAVLARIGAPA